MIQKSTIPFVLLSLLLLVQSCYTYQFNLSVLEPASIVLPDEIKRVSILPFTGIHSAKGVLDSISLTVIRDGISINDIKIGYLHGIYDVLVASPRFEKVVLTDTANIAFADSKRFFWDELDSVCTLDTTDVILLLNIAVSRDFFNQGCYTGEYGFYTGDYALINKTKWTFYLPRKKQILTIFDDMDTVLIRGGFALIELPGLLYDACYITGNHVGTRLCPHWIDVNRDMYTGPGRKMRTATRLIRRDQWSDAAAIWNELAESTDRIKAFKAASNMALAWERDDNLDQALLWATYADSLVTTYKSKLYVEELKKRIHKRNLLDQQMKTSGF